MTLSKEDATAYLDGLLDRRRGTLHNQAEVDAISVFKEMISSGDHNIPTDETSLQDILAIVLNQMKPRYRVVSRRSSGRNLVTFYRLQEESTISDRVKKQLENVILKAIEKVLNAPHA